MYQHIQENIKTETTTKQLTINYLNVAQF